MKPIEILVVDDDLGNILLIRQALAEEHYPINLRVAPDGRRACHMLASNRVKPDLVILELNLPKMSGLSVLQSTDPYVPVVVFTSFSSAADRDTALELGAVDFVQKPTHPVDFVHAVSEIVRQWTPVPAL
jgi:DNA-binding response OmpR family regulator